MNHSEENMPLRRHPEPPLSDLDLSGLIANRKNENRDQGNNIDEILLRGRLHAAPNRFLSLGIAMIGLGIVAVVWPDLSNVPTTLFVGCMLLLSGVVALIGALTIHSTDPFFSAFLLSLLSIVAGAFLLFNPHAGEIALTLLIAIIFIFQAAFETLFAIAVRPSSGWIPMLSSAIVSMAVALTTSIEPSAISVFMIGLLLAVNFTTTGLAYISIWRALKAPLRTSASTLAR